jgi:hypothetical protein
MANEKNLKPFKVGEDSRRNLQGRPKKYTTTLKELGYTNSQINDSVQVMLQMNVNELSDICNDNNATIMEKTVAAAMIKSLKNGSLYSLETLLTRVYGKPKETTAVENSGKIEFVITKGKTIL